MTTTWPELAIALYEKLTERNAEIVYTAENVEIHVPSKTGTDAEHAIWRMNGTIRIHTNELKKE